MIMSFETLASDTPQPTLQQPLSLQQASILYVISNLESFPLNMLALLPLKFRRDLLLMLPPADVLRLERTSVVNGIDMENEIWKVVCNRYDYQVVCTGRIDPFTSHNDPEELAIKGILELPEAIKMSSSAPFTWKASFLSCIFTLLLHMMPVQFNILCLHLIYRFPGERNYIFFLQLLFCTRFFTLEQIHCLGGFPLQVFGVTRHLSRHHQFPFPKKWTTPSHRLDTLSTCEMSPEGTIFHHIWWALFLVGFGYNWVPWSGQVQVK